MEKHFVYKADSRVCSKEFSFDYIDGRIHNVKVRDGCIGSTMVLGKLAEGLTAQEVIDRCLGISCNGIGTSCPDQLAQAVRECMESMK